jgi:hypothetical protein
MRRILTSVRDPHFEQATIEKTNLQNKVVLTPLIIRTACDGC